MNRATRFIAFLNRHPLVGLPVAVLLILMGAEALRAVAVLGYQDIQIISAPGNPASGYLRFSAQTGTLACLTSSGGNCLVAGSGNATSINGASVPASATFLATNSSSQITALTATQATAALNAFSSTLQGLAPLSGGGTTNYLRADGSWAAPAGSGSVASIATSNPITGGTITTSGTIACGTCTVTVANGTSAMGTGAISSGACASVVTTTATGTATTDNIQADFNADPTSTTGYSPSSNGMLTIIKYPTSNNVNFKVCNNTGSSITPGAVTLNWRVVR